MGLNPDESLSPALLEKATCLGTVLSSFPEAHRASETFLEQVLGVKRIERLTERIGTERVAQRDAETLAFQRLPLVEKVAAPPGVKAPRVAAVMPDGGRLQLNTENEDSRTHWSEYKAACLKDLDSESSPRDPCPDLPGMFLQRERIETLTREIGQKAPDRELLAGSPVAVAPESSPACELAGALRYQPPKVLGSDVIATRRNSTRFGQMLVARAWSLGMLASDRKAFVGDGSSWIWTIWERRFKPFGFTPILDIIHALTHVYAAATAGQSRHEGWEVYVRWITWVWQGQIAQVIEELATRQLALGPPTADDGPASVRRIVSETLTYLRNQSSRMNYPEYRQQGLPITSSHIESTVKLLNHRVKGSEKFWSERGAEALLQLKADTLSNTGHWDRFWYLRPQSATGTRTYPAGKA
ncbi:MAG: hypothetical protein K8R36_04795 [Planctomycetales bacterium]|nr:hypothetical protein [Planctomycetales bacterium]